MDINTLDVKHNPEAKRFEIQLGDQLAMVEYMLAGNNIIFTHTEVPPAFEGQGIANRMVKFALDYAVNAGYKIQPLCPVVKHYVDRHPEYQAHSWGY
ncbi:MAG TPA: GNAT family N-acetyltransferase [Oceanobacillus sp.]|nr:GNAT family N-acetyltransferase [Oceanobacillus sp.]